jgi:hypothetical protein
MARSAPSPKHNPTVPGMYPPVLKKISYLPKSAPRVFPTVHPTQPMTTAGRVAAGDSLNAVAPKLSLIQYVINPIFVITALADTLGALARFQTV